MPKGAKTSKILDPLETARNAAIKPGTPEMERFLQAGYGDLTVEEARRIIKERKENPMMYPYSEEQRCRAFLAAYDSTPIAIDTEPGWKRYPELQEE